MAEAVFPTKGNLINTKKSLELAVMGYNLIDRKRTILIREMVSLIDKGNELQSEIASTFAEAYRALQIANVTMGLIENYADGMEVENGVAITYRSVMGVEIPKASIASCKEQERYILTGSNSRFDEAYLRFQQVKVLSVTLAEVENSVCRLANEIKKTQRRANALANIIIPQKQETIRIITNALEEKDREEFSRMKSIKHNTKR